MASVKLILTGLRHNLKPNRRKLFAASARTCGVLCGKRKRNRRGRLFQDQIPVRPTVSDTAEQMVRYSEDYSIILKRGLLLAPEAL
jgi:hypothetical protein